MKSILAVTVCSLAVILSGCLDRTVLPEPIQPLPPAQSPINPATRPAEDSFSIESAVSTKLRLKIIGSKSEPDFCSKVAERLAESVVLSKAELTLHDPYDAVITITPEFELIDSDGDYYRINCQQVSVRIQSEQKTYAVKTVEPAPMPRKMGLKNAKNQYAKTVVAALTDYLSSELTRISNQDVAVTEMRFKLRNWQEKADPAAIASQVGKISQILHNMPGIINYTNIAQSTSQASVTFRIVYLKGQYPQGLVNAVTSKLATK